MKPATIKIKNPKKPGLLDRRLNRAAKKAALQRYKTETKQFARNQASQRRVSERNAKTNAFVQKRRASDAVKMTEIEQAQKTARHATWATNLGGLYGSATATAFKTTDSVSAANQNINGGASSTQKSRDEDESDPTDTTPTTPGNIY